jgi:hypothetical protein
MNSNRENAKNIYVEKSSEPLADARDSKFPNPVAWGIP